MTSGIDRLLDDLSHPDETGVRLAPDELLLIDWVLSAASRILPGADDLDAYMKWEQVRLRVWTHLYRAAGYLENDNNDYLGLSETLAKTGLYLQLDTYEARSLLAIIPTTFRWGTAPDCGFSLKAKLAQYIEGVYHDPKRYQDKAQAQNIAQSESGDKPAA